jgi:hypothetical protein
MLFDFTDFIPCLPAINAGHGDENTAFLQHVRIVGPLSLVRIIEELFQGRDTLYPLKLALTLLGRYTYFACGVQATEFVLFFVYDRIIF